MKIDLYPHQKEAIANLKNGCILCGDVGTGKSRTAIVYFLLRVCKMGVPLTEGSKYHKMIFPHDLYIITTAKKRDSLDWLKELQPFSLSEDQSLNESGIKIVIDSWNNIAKYKNVLNAFFIFDEQRVVGYGSWVKSFFTITRSNKWILLSATPGDTWSDYIPVFIANGFYKNKTDFARQHIVYDRFAKYPKIDHYINTSILEKHRNDILINMNYIRKTVRHRINCVVPYDKELYFTIVKDRWNPFDNEPIQETGKLCYLMRQAVNQAKNRIKVINDILFKHRRAIIFYNFTYELNDLREMLKESNYIFSEWNGEKHEEVPKGKDWVYLVQYSAGCEGWNCIETNAIIFYSLNYSYRMTMQAEGRIDRLNTLYTDLYFYYIKTDASIDKAISNALTNKKTFNEKAFLDIL